MSDKITTFLWFDGRAEAAMNFYLSIFPSSRVIDVMRFPAGGPAPAGSVLSATFELYGHEFTALNGGPQYKPTPAISFLIRCADQREVDHYWDKLVDGGTPMQCGWLTDKFGISWQVVPSVLKDYLRDSNAKKAGAVMQAMMQMVKFDVAKLKEAHESA